MATYCLDTRKGFGKLPDLLTDLAEVLWDLAIALHQSMDLADRLQLFGGRAAGHLCLAGFVHGRGEQIAAQTSGHDGYNKPRDLHMGQWLSRPAGFGIGFMG